MSEVLVDGPHRGREFAGDAVGRGACADLAEYARVLGAVDRVTDARYADAGVVPAAEDVPLLGSALIGVALELAVRIGGDNRQLLAGRAAKDEPDQFAVVGNVALSDVLADARLGGEARATLEALETLSDCAHGVFLSSDDARVVR